MVSRIGTPTQFGKFAAPDFFSGDGVTTAFNLSYAPGSVYAIDVYVNGVIQPNYLGGTFSINPVAKTITFTTAPSAGTRNVVVIYRGIEQQAGIPPDGSITTAMLIDNSVDYSKVAAGAIVGRAYGEYNGYATLTAAIPIDDTVPQIGEGTEVLSVSYAPKSAANRVRVRFVAAVWVNGPDHVIGALFNGASDAIATEAVAVEGAEYWNNLVLEHEYVPGSTSPIAFSARIGKSGTSVYLNGSGSGRRFGGTMKATMVVEEIKA